MAFDLKSLTKELKARGLCTAFHGVGGSGKTSLLAEACLDRNGVMLLGEEGLSTLKYDGVTTTGGVIGSWDEFMEILLALATETHAYKLVAIDAIDKLIPHLEKKVVKEHFDNDSKKAEAFKAKYGPMLTEFNRVLKAFSILQSKGIEVMVSVHSVVVQSRQPDAEPYSTYDMALGGGQKTSLSAALYDYCDNCIFLNRDVTVVDGKGRGGRLMAHTKSDPCWTAKSRTDLPESFLLSYGAYKELLAEAKK